MATMTTISGDTWDTLAVRAYGSDVRCQELMEANWPLLDYEIFPSGIVVTVPDISEAIDNDLPAWRT